MTDRLDEIRQRAEAATPGPWEFDGHVHGEKGCRCFSHLVVTGYTLTNPFPCCDETAEAKGASDDCTSTVVTFEDATFITHAREDIPYLLAEVERLRAALEVTLPYAMAHLEEYGFGMKYNDAVSEMNRLNEIADLIGASHFGGES